MELIPSFNLFVDSTKSHLVSEPFPWLDESTNFLGFLLQNMKLPGFLCSILFCRKYYDCMIDLLPDQLSPTSLKTILQNCFKGCKISG